jgi:hypothetical protein
MFFIHPVVQFLAILLAAYVFVLGWPRLRAAFTGGGAYFAWKRHVRLGLTALIVLLIGMLGGAGTTFYYRGSTGLTGWHYWIALTMTPLMLFSLVSGLIMDRRKARRKALPIVHGLVNQVMLLLALFQIWTGVGVLRAFEL